MKRQRSHRRHRRRDAAWRTKAIRRAIGMLERMGVPLHVLFGPLILWCGPPR